MKKGILLLVLMLTAAVRVSMAEETAVTLKEVVVTATKTEKDPKDVTQPVSVITADEIKKSGATDVATAIQNAAGVHIADYGTPGSVASASIRGAQSAQILVLMNGIRLNSSRDGGFDLSFIPVSIEDIDRIEIVRGPGSALYGADAVGGVINIITKKAVTDQSTLKGSVGSHGYDNIYLADSGRRENFSYAVSGSRDTSDGYRENSDLDQWIVGGRAGFDFSKTASMELTANYLDKEWGSPGSTVFGTTPHARQRDRNTVYGASYNGKIASTLDIKLSGYYKQDNLSYEDPDTIDFMTMLPAPTFNRYETDSNGGDLQMSWLVASWNQLTAGYELRRDTLESFDAQLGTARHAASLKAYYVQDEISIGEPLIIVIGGRNDDHSIFGDRFSPKASARYYVKSTETIIRASYGKSFRAPTFNDLYFNTSWGVGNPNLRPESAKEYEAGIEQKLGKNAAVKLSGFDRRVRDMIQWDWLVFPMQVNNIGRVRIRGYEAEASYRLADAVALSANYVYTNPVDELTHEKIYTIPQKEAKGSLTLYPEKDLYLTLEGRSVENYVKPGEAKWRYSVMDAKIAEKMKFGKGGEVYVAVNNVFDRKYEVVRGYPMPSQEIRGGVSLQF